MMEISRARYAAAEVLVVLTLIGIGLVSWHDGDVFSHFFPPEPAPIQAETRAIGALQAYASVQSTYKRRTGTFADRLAKLADPHNGSLLSANIARAGLAGKPYSGYLFHTPKAAEGKRDWTQQYCLVAQPARYDHTGVLTFIADEKGCIWQKDLYGRRVLRVPADLKAAGWGNIGD